MTLYFHDGYGQYGTLADMAANGYQGNAQIGSTNPPFPTGNGQWFLSGISTGIGTWHNIVNPATLALTSLPTLIFGTRFYLSSGLFSNSQGVELIGALDSLNGSQPQWHIATDGAGYLQFYRGGHGGLTGPAIGPAGTTLIQRDVWYELEVKVTTDSSAGVVEARLNNVAGEIPSTTGLNTQRSTTANTDQISWSATNAQYTDVYLIDPLTGSAPDNTFLSTHGGWRVQTNTVGANSSVQWTPNGAVSNFQCVDQLIPDGDTTYNSAAAGALKDLFTMNPLAGLPAIFGVINGCQARKDDAGARSLIQHLKSGATDSSGPTIALTQSYVNLSKLYEQDPATSAQWLAAAVNASLPGYESA